MFKIAESAQFMHEEALIFIPNYNLIQAHQSSFSIFKKKKKKGGPLSAACPDCAAHVLESVR